MSVDQDNDSGADDDIDADENSVGGWFKALRNILQVEDRIKRVSRAIGRVRKDLEAQDERLRKVENKQAEFAPTIDGLRQRFESKFEDLEKRRAESLRALEERIDDKATTAVATYMLGRDHPS